MKPPIRFYFDFASPYAYFASMRIEDLAREYDRPVEWCPVLVWAILKAHGIAPPMDAPVKRDYFLRDMERSARFLDVEYREPVRMPLSSHLAARLFHVLSRDHPALAIPFARSVFRAFFVEKHDIATDDVVASVAVETGIPRDVAIEGMKGQAGRDLLENAVTEAVSAGVVGSPFFVADGEGFFGADRLPQLRWHLEGKS